LKTGRTHEGEGLKAQYDETPYVDHVFEQLDLSRLLGMSRLFQLGPDAQRLDEVRVLDLACASGKHLRQQAALYPGVQFTGVDFSSSEIEIGRKGIAESGATNVELIKADLRDFEVTPGDYDVVICHGAFSWVPDDVKDRIFEISRAALKRRGVAVIAYLTYPGWKQREAVRELLAFRAHDIEKPRDRVRESALLLKFLHAGYSSQPENSHAQSLKTVVEEMQESSANVFLHDELGSIHDPCYFMQFAEWAGEWGMQYLSEVDLGTMALEGLPEDSAAVLQELSPDFLQTQQLIDFVVNRSGRTSMLVRQDAPIAKVLDPGQLEGLAFTTKLLPTKIDQHLTDGPQRFETITGKPLVAEDTGIAAIVRALNVAGPQPVGFTDVVSIGREAGVASEAITSALLELIGKGFVDPRLPLD
jgi:SAM-dependent methyltransferase